MGSQRRLLESDTLIFADNTPWGLQNSMQQWNSILAGLDEFMAYHCQAMIDYHNLQ
jgi:hypothetical protein